MTEKTIAAYAMNLMCGAHLDLFERDNLLLLCAQAGVPYGQSHVKLEAETKRRERAAKEQVDLLLAKILILENKLAARRPWWQFYKQVVR